MKKFLKNDEGFTLVELMVVVAIIGILSAVAIPNFKKYQAKSKQSEAKIQLAALYSGEVSASADHDTYGTCIELMGYEVTPSGYYTIGFNAGYDASGKFAGCLDTAVFVLPPTAQKAAVTASMPTAISDATALATETTFLAGAEGDIFDGGANDTDQWTIDQSKALVNSQVGYN